MSDKPTNEKPDCISVIRIMQKEMHERQAKAIDDIIMKLNEMSDYRSLFSFLAGMVDGYSRTIPEPWQMPANILFMIVGGYANKEAEGDFEKGKQASIKHLMGLREIVSPSSETETKQ